MAHDACVAAGGSVPCNSDYSAVRRRSAGGPDVDSSQGFKDYVEYNVEAESLGFASTFVVGKGLLIASISTSWTPCFEHASRLRASVAMISSSAK